MTSDKIAEIVESYEQSEKLKLLRSLIASESLFASDGSVQLHPSREITLVAGESKEAPDCFYRHYVRASVRSDEGGALLPLRVTENFWDVDNQWGEYDSNTLHRDDQSALWMTSMDHRRKFPAVRLDGGPQFVESVAFGWRGANRIGGNGKLRLWLEWQRSDSFDNPSTGFSAEWMQSSLGATVNPHLPSKIALGVQAQAVRLVVEDQTPPDPNRAPTWFLSLSSMQLLGRVGGTHEDHPRIYVSDTQNGRPLVKNYSTSTQKVTLWLLVPAEG